MSINNPGYQMATIFSKAIVVLGRCHTQQDTYHPANKNDTPNGRRPPNCVYP